MQGRHESWVEQQIREAQERGEFDNLPGAGKPLRSLEGPQEDDWWIMAKIEREQLDMSAALPPQLALRKEGQALAETILQEPSEHAVRELVEDFNARVRECWRRPMDGPVVAVRTVDVEEMVSRWHAHHASTSSATSAATAQAASAQESPERPRTWLQRLGLRPPR